MVLEKPRRLTTGLDKVRARARSRISEGKIYEYKDDYEHRCAEHEHE